MNGLWPDYVGFVIDRHQAWERRYAGEARPWTQNPILQTTKFTNVYRVLDAGSQFLLKDLLYPAIDDPETLVGRAFLYRYNNRPEPWEYFMQYHGRYPTADDFLSGQLLKTWTRYRATGAPVFGAAYRMFSGGENPGINRTDWAVNLAADAIRQGVPARLVDADGDPEAQLEVLKTMPRTGNFMAMQILTDVGYSGLLPEYDEDRWVMPGPGAKAGAKRVGMEPQAAMREARALFAETDVVRLEGLPPSLMDIQNTFCEFSKYARFLDGARARSYNVRGLPLPPYVLSVRWDS